MIQTLIGRKIDQTQKFLEDGKRVPVTLIAVGDNAVLQVKTQDKEAYTAVQLGFGTKKNPTKAASGHAKKAGFEKASAVVREVRVADTSAGSAQDLPAAGESVAVDAVFKPGDIVSVTGVSKGKGWAGVVKRHNFKGGPKTHGQSDRHRAPGSIGQTTTPGRVYKGKRMAGRMGSDQVTLSNLTVVSVDPETKTLMVTGLIPGHKDAIVTVTKTGERKKFLELIEEKVKREARDAEEAEKARIEAEKAAKEAEEAAKKAEEEAAKASASSAQEAEPVATAEEAVVEPTATVADATETVSNASETVDSPAEEVKVEDASTRSAGSEQASSAQENVEEKAEEVAVAAEAEEMKESEEKEEAK